MLGNAGLKKIRELEALAQRPGIDPRRSAYVLPPPSTQEFFSLCEADIRDELAEIDGALGKISFRESVLWPGEPAVRLFVQRKHVAAHLAELAVARSTLLDPACSLGEVEKTEVSMELFAAFGGHEEAIRKHLARYRATVLENIETVMPGRADRYASS